MERKPVSKALKTWFGVGDFMYNLCISFKTYYWMYFLTTVVALPLAVTSAANTIINVFDTILAFAWGAIIDSMRPARPSQRPYPWDWPMPSPCCPSACLCSRC